MKPLAVHPVPVPQGVEWVEERIQIHDLLLVTILGIIQCVEQFNAEGIEGEIGEIERDRMLPPQGDRQWALSPAGRQFGDGGMIAPHQDRSTQRCTRGQEFHPGHRVPICLVSLLEQGKGLVQVSGALVIDMEVCRFHRKESATHRINPVRPIPPTVAQKASVFSDSEQVRTSPVPVSRSNDSTN